MRAITLATAALLMIGLSAVPAYADHNSSPKLLFKSTDYVLVGTGPLSGYPTESEKGITQFGAACDPYSPHQGIDGFWYDLAAEGLVGDNHWFYVDLEDLHDADVYFYDENCQKIGFVGDCFINTYVVGGFLGCSDEQGDIPADAHYILIQNYFGAGTYTLAIFG